MNVLSLFAGIGGMDLGLERAGMTVVGQVEIDPHRRDILARHWPEIPRHDDVKTTTTWWTARRRPHVDLICGGFPCQPFSGAGKHGSIDDARWGWPWLAAVVRELAPRFVLLENVPGILRAVGNPFGRVLADLADLGFDAQWTVLSACAFGAPHRRRRLFVVAHPADEYGSARLAEGWTGALQHLDVRRGPWRGGLDGALASAGPVSRVPDGAAKRMVAAGGDAVVPQVAEHLGRVILATWPPR